MVIHMLGSHLGLFQWSLSALPVDHTEGDALWFRCEGPGHGRTTVAHGDGDGAVIAGFDEELSGAVAKRCDVIHREVHREPAACGTKHFTLKQWHCSTQPSLISYHLSIF